MKGSMRCMRLVCHVSSPGDEDLISFRSLLKRAYSWGSVSVMITASTFCPISEEFTLMLPAARIRVHLPVHVTTMSENQ